jgi:uncharacterized protein YndB with AHSA1/START domain
MHARGTERDGPPGRLSVTTPSDVEIEMTRTFDAPRALVFEALTRPEHLARWWGPRRYRLVQCESDLRPGGRWRFVQRDEDGREHAFRGEYREVDPPERVVSTFEYEGMPGHVSVETMTLVERDGRTTLTARSAFVSREDRDGMLRSGMESGARESYDRLGELLGPMPRQIVATRVFDAPRQLVFRAWTAEHVGRWWGPRGFTTTTQAIEVRPGGEWRFVMHGPDGRDYPNHVVFREVAAPERIVYDHVSGPPFHTEVSFVEEVDGRTRITMCATFETAVLRDRVVKKFGAVEGMHQTLERLGELVAELR